ncbi:MULTISPECIES: hypothetical protein [Delftia]|uniref:hypothetical protein n=1 Tax=Delftia TaxID=80865 RepID=UPI00020E8682|nr:MULTISPECIES: hypothetical protein [Delftia]AEF91078.1 hypothetical protein DelCs14_4095 [Delftia sp. Cs1-4]EZP51142.1 Hypothetical protein precursor [Delftia sp. RIT313]MBD9583832.1 hypothetical protein [Delftia sp. DLF01]MBO0990732.1 hypothetical protein [Delftia sp. SD083]MBO1034924.1 hypothetical protein [Delftia sp. SD018]
MKYVVYIGAVMGVFFMLSTIGVQGAPQEAALAAMACAFCIIPYVVFRVRQSAVEEEQRKKIIELLRVIAQDK